MEKSKYIKPGDVLPNGAIAIAAVDFTTKEHMKAGVVFAINKGAVEPYVAWSFMINSSNDVDMFSGHYFDNFIEAAKFWERNYVG